MAGLHSLFIPGDDDELNYEQFVALDKLFSTFRTASNSDVRSRSGKKGGKKGLIFTPGEFGLLLTTAEGSIQAMIAIGGLAGLNTGELMQLKWEDLRQVPGKIQIGSRLNTGEGHLVEICPALEAWLMPFSECSGLIWERTIADYQQELADLRKQAAIPDRRKGLHHSFSTYFAARTNWKSTSGLTINSAVTAEEAENWFAVAPKPKLQR